jgi:hypothetical protein
MANNTTPVTPEDIEAVSGILRELKERAAAAHKDNKLLIHSVYVELLNVASPIVVKLHARVEREDRASFNKNYKESRKAAREAQANSNGSMPQV